MNEKKKTHVCIIFYNWVCILMFKGHLIEYVCWWEFVCELFETLRALYSFYCIFWERDEWLSLRSSGSLSLPSLRSLLMWLHSMFDLSWTLLLFMLFVSSSSTISLLIHHFHFTSYSFLTATHLGFDTLFASSLHISHYQFILLHLSPHRHHIHVRHPQVYGSQDLLYMLHFIYKGMVFLSLGIWA